MQQVYFLSKDSESSKFIPDPHVKIFENITWGRFDEFFTPAFWSAQTWFFELQKDTALNYTLGNTFKEEVIACLLGGHGIPSEIGIAKFNQFIENQIFSKSNISLKEIENIMCEPMLLNGKLVQYRFAKQKAKYIHDAFFKIDSINEKEKSDIELRNFLLTINGIGHKTASWIVRNFRDSNNVAIIDIHLYRAGLLLGIFNANEKIDKHYLKMEEKFLLFCQKLEIQASKLDAVIWRVMKKINTFALSKLQAQNVMIN